MPDAWGCNPNAWSLILAEYTEFGNNKDLAAIFNLNKKISHITYKLNLIQYTINYLSLRRSEVAIQFLKNDLGFGQYSFDDMQSDLAKVVSISQTELTKKLVYEKQLIDLTTPKINIPETTMQSWEDKLSELAGFQNSAIIDAKIITVAQYLALEKRYNRHAEHLKNNQGRR